MELRNLTPHTINIVVPAGSAAPEIPPDPAGPARCAEKVTPAGVISVGGTQIPLIRKTLGEVTGLPDRQEGVGLIVSLPVAQAARAAGRKDVIAIGESVRDDKGRIVGAASLAVAP